MSFRGRKFPPVSTNEIIRSHETDQKTVDRNRDESGCNLHPFQDGNLAKYKTTRKSNDATIADEYPLASSIEGGIGSKYGRAIVQGATKGDQQGKQHLGSTHLRHPLTRRIGQANWTKKLWSDPQIPQAAKIKIVLTKWDPKKR